MLDTSKIIQLPFPTNQYMQDEYEKKIIVMHHTAGGSVSSTVNWWIKTPERVATPIVIDRNGDIYQIFSSKCWSHHIGLKHKNNMWLNQHSIGVELANYGWLKPNQYVSKSITYDQSYMGFKKFEAYPQAQIDALKDLLLYWGDRYGIDLTYNESMWNKNEDAINMKGGLWTHVSYLGDDKSDLHPQPEMIAMLKSLKK